MYRVHCKTALSMNETQGYLRQSYTEPYTCSNTKLDYI